MTSMRVTPCNWPLAHCGEASTGQPTCSSLAGLAPAMSTLVQNSAIEFLWHWTGRRFGTCPVTVRPCREECGGGYSTYGAGGRGAYIPFYEGSLTPALIGGQWYNMPCGGSCNGPCACSSVPTVILAGPVASITEVRVDGVVLASTAYRLDNYRNLVRIDGGSWPTCQNMGKSGLTDPGTFQVTYQLGIEVPSGGQVAAGVLACQMAKAACNDKSCQLPQRLQTITRQGVTMTVLDSYGNMYEHGTTGLFIVDSWVSSINASAKRAGMRIASPDYRPQKRVT